jgi:hypothetical protein
MATKTATTEPRNYTHLAGKAIGYGFLAGALAVSYTHIVHLFNDYGLHGWQAYAAPLFVDGFAMLGKLGRSDQFAADTRRKALWIQSVATAVSLIANVLAGGSIGGSVFGVLAVAGYVVAEIFVDSLRPVQAETRQQVKATRSAAAQKAAATRAANKAKADQDARAKARADRAAARKARLASITPIDRPDPAYI